MPGTDGFALVEKLRETRRLRAPAIMMLTSAGFRPLPGTRGRCLASGMDAYLSKPIRPQELDSVLQKFSEAPPLVAQLPERPVA